MSKELDACEAALMAEMSKGSTYVSICKTIKEIKSRKLKIKKEKNEKKRNALINELKVYCEKMGDICDSYEEQCQKRISAVEKYSEYLARKTLGLSKAENEKLLAAVEKM